MTQILVTIAAVISLLFNSAVRASALRRIDRENFRGI